jgi:hypothetical protein
MQNSIQRTMLAVVALVLVLIVGIWWGGHPSDLPPFLRNAFVSHPDGTVVDEALADIEHDYLQRLRATQLQNNAISGAIDGLGDPYAVRRISRASASTSSRSGAVCSLSR